MKRAIVILITLVMLTICGCAGKATVTSKELQEESMFVLVEESNIFDVVYHRDTKVMYAVSHGGSAAGNFCLLVNPDGTPMLWKGDN